MWGGVGGRRKHVEDVFYFVFGCQCLLLFNLTRMVPGVEGAALSQALQVLMAEYKRFIGCFCLI